MSSSFNENISRYFFINWEDISKDFLQKKRRTSYEVLLPKLVPFFQTEKPNKSSRCHDYTLFSVPGFNNWT